jgi:hypothetical protein
MRASRCLLLAGLLLGVAGCGDIVSPGSDRSTLSINRQKWASHGYTTYAFTLQQACFCLFTGPVRVYVDNDSVIDARQIVDNKAVDVRAVQTIATLFAFIDQGIASHAATLEVTYDSTLGYPSRIVYDGSTTIADDEVTYTVSDVDGPVQFDRRVVTERRLPRPLGADLRRP